jgi:hypothetical protein
VSQVPTFEVDNGSVSIAPRDATRLVERLNASESVDAKSAAAKIERATRLYENTTVRLAIGEDTAVLVALDELRVTGDFLTALARLERALSEKIQRES